MAVAQIVGVVLLGGAVLFGAYFFLSPRWAKKSRGPVFLFQAGGSSEAPQEAYAVSPFTSEQSPAVESNGEMPQHRAAPRNSVSDWDSSATERTTISPELRAAAVGSAASQGRGGDPGRRPGSRHGSQASPLTEWTPPDGTLQLLPGSLKIESGAGAGEVVRFVRVPGEEVVLTLGRGSGEPHRHVQINSPTVSRIHARMTFRDRKWTLRNESATNPTVVNGRLLEGSTAEVLLRDGDRIEMGEVAFAFQYPETSNRLPFRSSWYTDRGRRPTNQDAVAVRSLSEGRELAVVCDGIGSHASGGMASYIALEALVENLTGGGDLTEAVQEANRAVRRAAEESPDHDGMGTTLVALLREGERYLVANIGDSRAYRVDGNGIRQLTRDHSFVAEAVREGTMSFEEASRSPWRNAVTRNLGSEQQVEVDLFGPFDATAPHLVILCTDGVHGTLSDEKIEALVRDTTEVRDLARVLAEGALGKGSEDNVAVAVMEFSGSSEESP